MQVLVVRKFMTSIPLFGDLGSLILRTTTHVHGTRIAVGQRTLTDDHARMRCNRAR